MNIAIRGGWQSRLHPFFLIGSSILLVVLLLSSGTLNITSAQADDDYRVIYVNDAGEIIAMNPVTLETSVLLNIEDPIASAVGLHPSPDGNYLAVFTRIGDDPRTAHFRFYVVSVADGQVLLDQDLLSDGYVYPEDETLGNAQYELTRALGEVLWSPTGNRVAFISAQEGTADVFTFEPSSQTLARHNDAPNTAAFLNWNPSGTALVFSELVSFGAGAGYQIHSYNVVDMASNQVRQIPLSEPANSNGIGIVGWLDDLRLIYSPYNFVIFGASGIDLLDLNSLESTEVLPPHLAMTVPVFDQTTRSLAFTVPDVSEGGLVPGAYLWREGNVQPQLLQSGAFYVVEAVRAGQFQFEAADGSYLLNVDATDPVLMPLPANDYGAFVSPNPSVDAVVLARVDGTYISSIQSDNASLVWGEQAQIPIWSPDGTKFYSFGFTGEGAGLVEVDAVSRSLRLLDSRMAVTSPRAVTP